MLESLNHWTDEINLSSLLWSWGPWWPRARFPHGLPCSPAMMCCLSSKALRVWGKPRSLLCLPRSFCSRLWDISLSSFPHHGKVLPKFFPSWNSLHFWSQQSILRCCRKLPNKGERCWNFWLVGRLLKLGPQKTKCSFPCKSHHQFLRPVLICIYNFFFQTIFM